MRRGPNSRACTVPFAFGLFSCGVSRGSSGICGRQVVPRTKTSRDPGPRYRRRPQRRKQRTALLARASPSCFCPTVITNVTGLSKNLRLRAQQVAGLRRSYPTCRVVGIGFVNFSKPAVQIKHTFKGIALCSNAASYHTAFRAENRTNVEVRRGQGALAGREWASLR
jgi:hypothetical protein